MVAGRARRIRARFTSIPPVASIRGRRAREAEPDVVALARRGVGAVQRRLHRDRAAEPVAAAHAARSGRPAVEVVPLPEETDLVEGAVVARTAAERADVGQVI